MKKRYQDCGLLRQIARWLMYRPFYTFSAVIGILVWLVTGATIKPFFRKQGWSRWQIAQLIFFERQVMADYRMQNYSQLDETLRELHEFAVESNNRLAS